MLVKRDGTPWTGNTTPAQRVAPFHKILADLQERVTSETLADLPAQRLAGWRPAVAAAREAASFSINSEGWIETKLMQAIRIAERQTQCTLAITLMTIRSLRWLETPKQDTNSTPLMMMRTGFSHLRCHRAFGRQMDTSTCRRMC